MLTVISNKGQIVIPASIRRKMKIKKGTKFYVEEKGDKIILKPLTEEYLNSLAGILKTGGKLIGSLKRQRKLDKEFD